MTDRSGLLARAAAALEPFVDEAALVSYDYGREVPTDPDEYVDVEAVTARQMREALDTFYALREAVADQSAPISPAAGDTASQERKARDGRLVHPVLPPIRVTKPKKIDDPGP